MATGQLKTSNRMTSKPTLDALLAFFRTEEDERFLSALSDRDRRLVRLVIAGYTYASIAEELGMTKQNVSRVARMAVGAMERSRAKAQQLIGQ